MSGFEYKIDDHKVLTRMEERAAFKAYRNTNSKKAQHFIIEHNLKFAIHCANAYITKYPHVDPMDLRSYAVLGLYEAFDKFDIESSVKFISYAVWWVKATIIRNVQSYESLIRLPANVHQDLQKALNKKEFTEDVLDKFNTIGGGMSMDARIGNEGEDNRSLGDTIADDMATQAFELVESEDTHTKLFVIIDKVLTERERYIILEHYGFLTGEIRTLASIGEQLGMSREHARNIKNKACTKMFKELKKWK